VFQVIVSCYHYVPFENLISGYLIRLLSNLPIKPWKNRGTRFPLKRLLTKFRPSKSNILSFRTLFFIFFILSKWNCISSIWLLEFPDGIFIFYLTSCIIFYCVFLVILKTKFATVKWEGFQLLLIYDLSSQGNLGIAVGRVGWKK